MSPLELAEYVAAVAGVLVGIGLGSVFVALLLVGLFDKWDKRK